jgi:hypothetical protein
MSIAYATSLRNARLDIITSTISANGRLRIYSGTRPATGGAETTLLADMLLATPAAPPAGGGVLTLTMPVFDTSANASGTATWARILKDDGTFVADLSVTVTGGGGDLQLSSAAIVVGNPIVITSFTITEANG